MSKTIIDKMVDRFLCWKLPEDFGPDCYITFDSEKAKQNPHCWPVGTNLLTAEQAKEMIEHMLAGVVPPEKYATEEEGEAYMHGYFDGESAKTPYGTVGICGGEYKQEFTNYPRGILRFAQESSGNGDCSI